jgi:hypothetical protein
VLLRFRAANVYSFRDEFELDLRPRKRGEGGSHPSRCASPRSTAPTRPVSRTCSRPCRGCGKRSSLAPTGRPLAVYRGRCSSSTPLLARRRRSSRLEFLLEEVRYVYGFEVSDERVETEWLFEYATGRRRTLFVRDADAEDEYEFKGRQLKGELEQIRRLTRPNALFVSIGAQLNNPQLARIFQWFTGGSVAGRAFWPRGTLGWRLRGSLRELVRGRRAPAGHGGSGRRRRRLRGARLR